MKGGWLITADHIGEGHYVGTKQGVINHRELANDGVPFRLYDDDNNLYFEGLISENWIEGEADFAFAPLDWAMAVFGCTHMEYFNGEKWEEL